jgi:OOP family OmpA-OmpF porin
VAALALHGYFLIGGRLQQPGIRSGSEMAGVGVAYDRRAESQTVPLVIFWLLALWVLVVLVALVWGVDNAETTLRAAARASLAADGHDIAVDFSGRDTRLIGSVTQESLALEIEESIDSIVGVRSVNNEIIVDSPEVPPLRQPHLEFRLVGDVVSIRGLIPDEETEQSLLEAIVAQYGEGNIVAALTIAEDVEAHPWLSRIEDAFAPLQELRAGGFAADSDEMIVTGEVISDLAGQEMTDSLELVLGELLAVTTDLTIAVLPPPTFSASGDGGAVILEGILPSQESVDRIDDAAKDLHPDSVVFNIMRAGDVSGPMWLESIEGLLDIAARLDPWMMTIAEGTVSITGMGQDQDVVDALDVLITGVVGGNLVVVTEVEVDPRTVAVELTKLLEGNAIFESNSTVLSAEGLALLDMAIEVLRANPATVVVVEGHTDSEGNATVNLELSQQCAEAVVAYLVVGGIDPDRLSAVGYGEEQPIATNSTEVGRAQNRRIEFVIREGDG